MNPEIDSKFTSRIQSGISTVKQWEEDQALLREIRESIPFRELIPPSTASETPFGLYRNQTKSPYRRPDDAGYSGDDLLLKRLTVYFQKSMTWVNNPPCEACGNKDTSNMGQRGPESPEEKEGRADRVEMYSCGVCGATTTFPRYNSTRMLFKTKKGRCGEYANLFGCYCRAVGFDQVRYILDSTDHVWTEVYSPTQRRYIMADGCEGLIDKNSMYEKGWGKKLVYILAFSVVAPGKVQVVDVTRRYTRQMHTEPMQERRRGVVSTEAVGQMLVAQFNSCHDIDPHASTSVMKRLQEIKKREQREHEFLEATVGKTWDEHVRVGGRISGDLAWRAARNELGSGETTQTGHVASGASFHVDSFLPSTAGVLSITLTAPSAMDIKANTVSFPFHSAITVSHVPCSVGDKGINVVILDERNGCILQSRVFSSLGATHRFLDTVPDGRVVALAVIDRAADNDESARLHEIVGGFPTLGKEDKLCVFVGQVGYRPSWATSVVIPDADSGTAPSARTHVEIALPDNTKNRLALRTEHNTAPSLISGRVPDLVMPLDAQLKASLTEKMQAFQKSGEKYRDRMGFVTKAGHPVYWFTLEGFPLKRVEKEGRWVTCHWLPEELVPDEKKEESAPIVVPVNTDEFSSLLGPSLIQTHDVLPLEQALSDKRLVALYFSAHWCPPCKAFTPMLAEFYESLKRDLEVVFISSDRDEAGFASYFGTMPWLALPFKERARKDQIAARFQIRGIPSLIVMDTVSGQVVSNRAREEVMRACRFGDSGAEELLQSWLSQVPEETQALLETLKLSMEVDSTKSEVSDFLVRSDKKQQTAPEKPTADRIKEIFSELVAEGTDPSAAAAQAIQRVADEQKHKSEATFDSGSLNDVPWAVLSCLPCSTHPSYFASDGEKAITAFNDGNQTRMRPLRRVRLLRDSGGKVVGVQCVYDTENGPKHELGLAEDTKKSADWVDAEIGAGEAGTIFRIDGTWGDSGIETLSLVTTSDGKEVKQMSDHSFSLHVPNGFELMGFHGVLSPSGIISLGLVCYKQHHFQSPTKQSDTIIPSLPSTISSKALALLNNSNSNQIRTVLTTARKYLENILKDPSAPKFKSFRSNNKVFDRIASVPGAVELLYTLGFSSYETEEDWMICVPLAADVQGMDGVLTALLEYFDAA